MFFYSLIEPIKALGNATSVAVFVALHVLAALLYLSWVRRRQRSELNLPVVGDPNALEFREAMEEGARKVANSKIASQWRTHLLNMFLVPKLSVYSSLAYWSSRDSPSHSHRRAAPSSR